MWRWNDGGVGPTQWAKNASGIWLFISSLSFCLVSELHPSISHPVCQYPVVRQVPVDGFWVLLSRLHWGKDPVSQGPLTTTCSVSLRPSNSRPPSSRSSLLFRSFRLVRGDGAAALEAQLCRCVGMR